MSDTGASTLLVLGQRLRPFERIATIGAVLGLTRATAYRVAVADEWPMAGPEGSRFVVVPALLNRLGIEYEVDGEAASRERPALRALA